uniref:Prolyl 4-hydroxylase alpha subunit domain-containing protein n=1 Tax=Aplanochytrium stocchinoi TaxID=215587 RepID=A0A7S3V368_9STRA
MKSGDIVGRHAKLNNINANHLISVSYTEGAAFDSIILGERSEPIRFNSVLLIPNLLTKGECAQLIQDVEQEHLRLSENGPTQDKGKGTLQSSVGTERYMIKNLSEKTRCLFDIVLRDRLLPLISAELPDVEDMIWCFSMIEPVKGAVLGDMWYKFSSQEPSINRYANGGDFKEHTDGYALTLNILLSVDDDFTGGGTEFWREDESSAEPTLRLEPTCAGTGVIFNGQVKHAGRAVIEGVRHLLVASFNVMKAKILYDRSTAQIQK